MINNYKILFKIIILGFILPTCESFASSKTYGKHLSYLQKHELEKFNATLDTQVMDLLRNKYNLKKVPEIYKSSDPRMIPMTSFSYSFLKKPIVIYNPEFFNRNPYPKLFDEQNSMEFALLHELGHAHLPFLNTLYLWIKTGIGLSVVLALFFNLIQTEYRPLASFAPFLFDIFYLRYFEEPRADDFAIDVAYNHPEILENGMNFLNVSSQLPSPYLHSKDVSITNVFKAFTNIFKDPSATSRIIKIENALNGHPNYFRIIRLLIGLWVIKKAIQFAYEYSISATTLQRGLDKIQEINNNFDSYCDKFQIPTEGRPMFKDALQVIASYFKEKLARINANTEIIIDEQDVISKAFQEHNKK